MLPKGHYINFKVNGRISAAEYEQIKKLSYKDQIKALLLNSDTVITSADTDMEKILSSDDEEPG